MNVTLPLWLVISQWVLLFALGILVFVVYRQLGYILSLKDIGSERDGLPIGEKAPAFDYTLVHKSVDSPHHFDPKGRWSLLLFADPGCISCQSALRALEHLAPEVTQIMQILVVTGTDPALIAAVEEFRTASVDNGHIDRDMPLKLYHTHANPFMYLIDPEGIIQAKGIAPDESAIRKNIQKVDRSVIKVESIVSKQEVRG